MDRTISGRVGPCWDSKLFSTMPRFGSVVMDPAHIENRPSRQEYTESWRRWCQGKLPHEIPSYIRELFHAETLTPSTSSRSDDGASS